MFTAFWILAGLLHLAAAAAASLHVLLNYRRSSAAVAWLFALWGLPLFGALTYLCLAVFRGRPSLRRDRLNAKELRGSRIREQDVADAYRGGFAESGFAQLAEKVCSLPITRGNHIELIEDDQDALRRQIEAIGAANEEVLLQTYVFSPGGVVDRLIEALAERAKAGVAIKLLVDPIGSPKLTAKLLQSVRDRGMEFHTFMKPNPLKGRFQVNFRNHRKLLCVDGKTAFTGGRNWADEYYSDGRGATFSDTSLELRGPAVSAMRRVFLEDWTVASGDTASLEPREVETDESGPVFLRVLPFGFDEPTDDPIDLLAGAFRSARESIFIATPYFVPGDTLHRALRVAALSGVQVDILIPEACERRAIDLTAQNYFTGLIDAGVRIHRRKPPMLHAKAVIVDGIWATVGSVNFDNRSFRLNYEMNIEVLDVDFAETLRRYFDCDLEKSEQVSPESFAKRSRWQRLLQKSAALFEPLM